MMSKPTIVFVDHDHHSVDDIIHDLNRRVLLTAAGRDLSQVFDFRKVVLDPAGEPANIARRALGEIRKLRPCAILVALYFDDDPYAATWQRGAKIANELRKFFPSRVAIGVYSPFDLQAAERIRLSEYRFHVVLEGLHQQKVMRKEFSNDEWHALLERLTVQANTLPRIFLSHAHGDARLAAAVKGLLETALDLKKDDIIASSASSSGFAAGSGVKAQAIAGVSQASCVIVLMTPNSVGSNYVWFEYGLATATPGLTIVPLATREGLARRSRTPIGDDLVWCCSHRDDLLKLVTAVSKATGADPHTDSRWELTLETVLHEAVEADRVAGA